MNEKRELRGKLGPTKGISKGERRRGRAKIEERDLISQGLGGDIQKVRH